MKILTLILGALVIMAAATLLAISIVGADAFGIVLSLTTMAGVIASVNLIYDV